MDLSDFGSTCGRSIFASGGALSDAVAKRVTVLREEYVPGTGDMNNNHYYSDPDHAMVNGFSCTMCCAAHASLAPHVTVRHRDATLHEPPSLQ